MSRKWRYTTLILLVLCAVGLCVFLWTSRSPHVNRLAGPGEVRWKVLVGPAADRPAVVGDIVLCWRAADSWSHVRQQGVRSALDRLLRKPYTVSEERCAYDAASGKLLWRHPTSIHRTNFAGGVLYDMVWSYGGLRPFNVRTGKDFGRTNMPMTNADSVLEIDNDITCFCGTRGAIAFNPKTGQTLWTLSKIVASGGEISAVVDDGALYVETSDGVLRAIDCMTGIERWMKEPYSMPTALAAADGVVAFATVGEKSVRVLDARDGSDRWTRALSPRITLSIAIRGGRVYAGGADGLHCMSADDGRDAWVFPVPEQIAGRSFTARDGAVYYSQGTVLYVLEASTGKLMWRFDAGGTITMQPCVTADTVYVTTGNGWLYAIATTPPAK